MASCRKCGKELLDGAKFCPNCGNKVKKSKSPQKPKGLVDSLIEGVKEGWQGNEFDSGKEKKKDSNWKQSCLLWFFLIMGLGWIADKCSDDDSTDSSIETYEDSKTDSYLGTYEVTDKVGCTIHITLNKDKTATITGVRGENITYYCTWEDYSSIGIGLEIYFSDEKPYLVYDGGGDTNEYTSICLKDGWLYSGSDKSKAKNPQWRLKAKKIK